MLARIFRFITSQGAVPGMQLAHAGRKASTSPPWQGGDAVEIEDGGWRPIFAPSDLPFTADSIVPEALDHAGIQRVVVAFAEATRRALKAGAQVLEIHAAHGYLIHEFLSPLSNRRTDEYGGSFENRTRVAREIVQAVRRVWPEHLPLLVRISATDWAEGGWDIDQSMALACDLKTLGVDMIDCSSGGAVPGVKIPLAPSYQVPFAERIRHEAEIATAAVGLITSPAQAEDILAAEQADLILMAREFLRDPYWPIGAAAEMGEDCPPPVQYGRAFAHT